MNEAVLISKVDDLKNIKNSRCRAADSWQEQWTAVSD